MSLIDGVNANYWITFYDRVEPWRQIRALAADVPSTPSAGGGGYNVIALPMRSAVTVWQGRPNLLTMDVPIVLLAQASEPTPRSTRQHQLSDRSLSTAAQADRLIQMWRPADDHLEPPQIKIKAAANLVPYTELTYVMEDFTWDTTMVQSNEDGERILQKLVIKVMEYRDDERLQTVKAKKAARRRNRVYVVKAGDTLSKIAARYRLKGGWKEIADAQTPPIRDPRGIKVGQRLRIP